MSDTETEFYEQAKTYAESCISNLREMLDQLDHARRCDGEEIDGEPCEHKDDPDWHDEDLAEHTISNDPLSIQVQGDWHAIGEESDDRNGRFEILLTTGGPAARILGELRDGQPYRAWFEYQDWFKPWTEVILDSANHATILEYAQYFYFGE